MTMTRTATEILDNDFPSVRHRILDIAAALDRMDRGESIGELRRDPRTEQMHAALAILTESETGRAARVQAAFSRPYDPNWRK